ncbi:uncharacterized protein LOC130625575 [Hydractinia symbiolongicarpus]|uniref:uncharacterized protein LOC130625575 n=1 Tax=Hydractinia symbiolongicarpus TaxID=13093 RepID=UPI0025510D7F|nr:uncharacterized protein LOC130625575 [Hydractinia symbiolongicarpus]
MYPASFLLFLCLFCVGFQWSNGFKVGSRCNSKNGRSILRQYEDKLLICHQYRRKYIYQIAYLKDKPCRKNGLFTRQDDSKLFLLCKEDGTRIGYTLKKPSSSSDKSFTHLAAFHEKYDLKWDW